MPDTINNSGYNRANDFLDRGYANLNPSAPPTQFPQVPAEGAQETPVPSAQDIFDSIGQNLRQTAVQQNPFISSTKFNTPVKTPLDQTIRYDSPRYGYNPFNPELEHQYAARQGWFEAWKNNILKFGAQAGGTFLETVTAIPQVINGLGSNDLSKIYNNPLSNSISDWTEGLEQTLPNYQSAFEEQHPVLSYIPGFASLKTLGDKWGGVLKTLGFVVGSVGGAVVQDALVGAATGGVGELPLIEPQLMAFTGKIGKIFAAPGGAVKLAESIKNGMAVEDAINGVYNTVKNTDRFRYGLSLFTTATGGSIIFANGVYNDVKKNLTDEFYSQHGRDPQDGDFDRIQEYARTAGNVDLFANTALQMKVFDSVFGTLFKPTSAVMREAESKVPVALQKGSIDVFESVNPQTKFSILKKIGGPLKTQLTTAAEMAGIYGIGRSAEDYAKRKFDDESVSDTDNFTRSLATGLYDTFTTEQGIENIMIGVLGGALIHGGKSLLESKRGIENNSDVISKNVLALLNSSKVSDVFKNTYNEAVTADSLAKSMKKAAESGDIFEYQNLKFQQLFNFVSSGAKAGKYELRAAQLEMLKDLTGTEFQKMFGLDYNEANRRTVSDYVDAVIKKSKDIKENIDKVDTVFKNPFEQTDRKNYVAFEEYKNQLALDLSEMNNNRERLKSITAEISKVAPLLDKNKLIDLTHEVGIGQTVKRFEDRIKQIEETNKLADKSSEFYKQDQQEKTFLQEKVKELNTGDRTDYHPDLYNTIGEVVNYYSNGDSITGDNNVHPIDLLPMLTNAQDAFKLENANNRALYHYQQLTGKKGFDNYIQDVLKSNNANYERFMNSLVETLTNPQKQEQAPVGGDVLAIDENGNPTGQAPKTETKNTKAETKKPEVKITIKKTEETPEEKKEAERARKDYESKRAEIEKAKQAELKETEKATGKPLTPEVKNDIEEKYATQQTELEKNQPVILSTTKADEEVDISEIENPEAQATTKAAQDTRATKHGALKNSIYKSFAPFVYVNRIYSRNYEDGAKEQDNLRNAIFKNTPQKLYDKIQVNVSRSTKGKKSTEYSKIQGTNIYRRGYAYDIDVIADGDVLGKIQPGDTLFYKKGDNYQPLTAVSKDEYQKVTGNEPSTYDEFVNDLKAYQEVTDTILDHFEKTGKKTFNNAEIKQLFNIHVRYGQVDYAKSQARATPLSDLKYKTNGDFVISIPAEYGKDGKLQRSGEPTILNENELNSVDAEKAWQFIADNIDQIKRIDSRYVYVTKMPNGGYEKVGVLAARPREIDTETANNLVSRIVKVTGTTDKADIRRLNHDLRNDLFITDTNNRKGAGTTLHLYVHEDGKVYINVLNKNSGFRQGYFLPDAKSAKNLEDLVAQIDKVLARKANEDGQLRSLNLKVDVKDFKTSVSNADRIPLSELREKLDVTAPHENIFDNFGLHVMPLKSKPSKGFTPREEKTLEPEEASLVETLQKSIDQVSEPIKEQVETLANAGVDAQKELAETIVSVAQNDPEGAKEALGEKVVEKAQEVAKTKPAKKRIVAKPKKVNIEQTQEVATEIAKEEHPAPQVQTEGSKAPEVQPEEPVTLETSVQEQVTALPKIDVPSLHIKTKSVEEVNDKYAEQLNNLNNEIDKIYVKREGLLDFQKKRELTDDEKKQLENYNNKIERLNNDIKEYSAERDKELEALRPAPDPEVGDKVMYEGKEAVVSDVSESGNGEPVFTLTDGGEGESVVYKDKIYKIDETLGDPVELPPAVSRDLEIGDKVWFNNKQYKVLAVDKEKASIQDSKTGDIKNVFKEAIIPHDEAIDDTYAVEYTGLKGILDTLQKRFNIKYQIVDDPGGNWKGRFKDGIVYLNKSNVDRTTPFHEYLHPFMKVLEIDNPELYKNLSTEFDRLVSESLDDAATEAISETKRMYKDSSPAEQQQEALVRYISKIAAQNVNKEGQKLGGQYNRAMRSLIERFTEWLGKMWNAVFGSKLKNIPTEATLQDMADVISLTDYSFDLRSRMDVVDNMDVFQKDSDDFNTEILDRLKRNLDKFSKTAQRLNSEELGSEARAIRILFENKTEAESLNSFVYQGMRGLSWAIDEFKRITGKIKNPENNLDSKDIQELNKSLDVVKQMVAFYREDVNDLFKRIGDRKHMDDEEYRTYAETLREANVVADKIQTRSVDLMVEWLYPAVEHTNELIREKYPDFVLTKDAFRKELYNATGDVDRLFFALGSVGSSKDPVSAIVSNVIKDVVEDAHRYDAVLSHIVKTGYDEFLKREGLSNDRNKTTEHYKNNFLRKARILEKVGENEAGEPKYEYVERWAFHQDYFYDKWVEEYEDFVKSLGAQPEEKVAQQAWINKLHDWQAENGTINAPAKRFLNPEFLNLYEKDKMFTILYDMYKEGNENLHAEEQLQFGIVPQVSKGKNMFSDLNWSKVGAINAAKHVKDFFYPKAEEGNEFDINLTNMDGSVYKKIRVAYIRPLEEADLDLALPETVFKFAGVANLSKNMRELEPNIRTLKSLLDGDSQFIKKARGVVDVIKKSKGNKPEQIVNSVFSSKKAGRLALVNKQLSAFIDDVVYGETEVKDTFGKLDLNKWGNNMAFVTALNNMAFNITAGISNVIIGDIQAFGEAIGGKYYKPENYRKAQGQYWSSIGDFANDVSALKKSKITQLGVKYDAIQGEFRDKYGKRFVGNVMQKYASADTLFIFNHAGEHHIQLTGMLSLMDATKVKMADGSTVSLFDAHEVSSNGYLKLKDGAQWTDEQNNDFTKRLHSLNKILNGNYSKFDKAYLQRKWYGKLALVYRKYLYNAFRARYGKKRLDYELQDVYEGYYRTFFNKLGKDIKAYKFEAAKRMLTREGWTADEKYAYNKTMYELGLFTGITMLGIAIGANQSKEDDKSWGRDYLTLLMLRARGDVGQYTLFGATDMLRIMKNPSAVIQALSRYSDFFLQLTTQPFATYNRKTGPFAAGTSVLQAKMLKAIPILRQVVNLMSPAEQKKFYTLINKNF